MRDALSDCMEIVVFARGFHLEYDNSNRVFRA